MYNVILLIVHCLCIVSPQNGELLIGMDKKKLLEESYQRVYQYLTRFGQGSVDKFVFNPSATEGTAEDWIKLITRFEGVNSKASLAGKSKQRK